MDACCAVEREVDKVLSKFGSINEHADRILQELILYVEGLRRDLEIAPEDQEITSLQKELLQRAMTKVKDTVSRLATDHRDLHSTVSKVGKAIDRNFVQDFAATSREDVFSSPERIELLNKVICQHFCRQGLHEVADELAKEADIESEVTDREPFTQLNHILDCIKNRDLEPAVAWATAHHEALKKNSSCLEFKLHRLKYIETIRKGVEFQTEAIAYARSHFKHFVDTHEKDIQMLMGMLLYVHNDTQMSPYSCYFETEMWIDIYETFTRDACIILGITVNSPLSVCINAGCTALPALLNIKQVMSQRQVAGIWNGKDELPIEIDLGSDNRYHSTFACPILRQQSTESNPPMRLVCGHVISRDALNKLCNNGNKMKCPYCPVEQSPSDARLIFF